MAIQQELLTANERIIETYVFLEDPNVDFSIHTVSRPDLPTGDEVLLEIREASMPCILTGGRPVNLNVLKGFGRLTVVDLNTGNIQDSFLEEGSQAEVTSNKSLYWVENVGDEPLIIRDYCDDFDPANEPSLKSLVSALISLI